MNMAANCLLSPSFFPQYGEIEEGPLGFDRQSGRSRGFALFIFKLVEATQVCVGGAHEDYRWASDVL